MIQKVYRGSDLLIAIGLKDVNGDSYRVIDLNEFKIKFYTLNPDNYVEATFEGNLYTNIIADEDADYAVLNSDEIEKLEDGVINYIYSIRAVNADFKDGFYDEVVRGQTNLYLKCNGSQCC